MIERFLRKDVRHQSHAAMRAQPLLVHGDDPRRLLTAMLQPVQTEVRQVRRIRMSEDRKDATLVDEGVARGFHADTPMCVSRPASQASKSASSGQDASPTDSASPPVVPIGVIGAPAAAHTASIAARRSFG